MNAETTPAGAEVPSTSQAAPDNGYGKLKVLLVDDDSFMLRTIQLVLRGIGVTDVETAEGGQAAVDRFDGSAPHPDIVLTDLTMPGVDGMGVIKKLADAEFKGGVGLVSGNDERILESVRQLAEARNLRVLGVLKKPVNAQVMSELIERNFEAHYGAGDDYGTETSDLDALSRAISNGHIVPYYQPIVSAKGPAKHVYGAEALARWVDPVHGITPPNQFIPLAEESDLLKPMTLAIVEHALRDLAHWKSVGLSLTTSINIAVGSLDAEDDFFDQLCAMTGEHGVDPSEVIIELTERQVMTNVADAIEVLTRLRMHGFQLALDDFGTGHSSMQQLQRVPFTELKVDRAFVHQAERSSSAMAILDSSVTLGNAMSMSMVAEGVETEDDLDTVVTAGIDLVQGYFFAKPMAGEEFVDWVLKFHSDAQGT